MRKITYSECGPATDRTKNILDVSYENVWKFSGRERDIMEANFSTKKEAKHPL